MSAIPDARIVCLVPSVTELLFALGLGPQVVGRTGFCVHPWDEVREVPKVGGTKDVKLDRVRELAPTHVVVNVDENRREDAEALAGMGFELVVTHPLGPLDNLDLYRQLGRTFGREREAERLCAEYERALARVRAATLPARDVLYLIWKDPWMTVGPDTYVSRTLALFNWRTLPAQAPPLDLSRPEGEKSQAARYPEVDLEAFAGVDLVLLSSEPFHFKQAHVEEVAALLPDAEVSLIDGEMTSWYGPRAIAGLDYMLELATGAAR